MMIDNIREYLKTCPYLKNGKINVDYLGEAPVRYTIDAVPSPAVLKHYAGGDTLRQFVFVFASREYYGQEVLQNMQNNSFYESFAAWLEEQSEAGELPSLESGKTAQSMEALTSGYLYDGDTDNARYQIQCRLVYYQSAQ